MEAFKRRTDSVCSVIMSQCKTSRTGQLITNGKTPQRNTKRSRNLKFTTQLLLKSESRLFREISNEQQRFLFSASFLSENSVYTAYAICLLK